MGEKKTPPSTPKGLGGVDFIVQSVSNVGQQSNLTGTLDGGGQVALMSGAGAGGTAGQNLATLGQETAKLCSVLVIDAGHFVHAESAYLLALAGTNTLFVSHGIYLLVRVEKFNFKS